MNNIKRDEKEKRVVSNVHTPTVLSKKNFDTDLFKFYYYTEIKQEKQ